MINNNVDFEKNCNTTTSSTGSVQNAADTADTVASNAVHHTPPPTTTNTNDNSYFNRFDNRIAANLAAVLTGSRFRSSSASRQAAALNCNSNTTRLSSARRRQQNCNGSAHPVGLQLSYKPRPGCALPGRITTRGCGLSDGASTTRTPRSTYLFNQAHLNCNDNEKVAQTPSSEEDNSPTELNNCKRLADKPPLVKRLTMGLLRSNEDARPLVALDTPTSDVGTGSLRAALRPHTPIHSQLYADGYVNEEAFEPEKFIASKFGDSCRQSLTAIPMLDTLNLNDNSEFNLKKRYLRETSSANSSPKIFANRLRTTSAASRFGNNASSSSNTSSASASAPASASASASASSSSEEEEADLKEASWFQAGISREIAEEALLAKSPGAFFVRRSTSKPGCYALSLRVPSPPGPQIANYIILQTARGYKIKGFRKEFSSLKALITHHSVMPELLPVPLAMPRPANVSASRRNLDDFDTYDSLQMLLKYLRAQNMDNE